MKKYGSEIITKAKEAKTPEEIVSIAKENGMEMTAEEAQAYFDQLNRTGELSDDELDNVAGGGCSQQGGEPTCPKCGTVLTVVHYADPDLHSYRLCYGCGKYGLWHSGSGTKELPELRAQAIVEKTR